MRLLSYFSPRADAPVAGVLADGAVHGGAGSLVEVISGGHEAAARWADAILASPVEVIDLADTELVAPIPDPPSVRDFMAFEYHALRASQRLGKVLDPVWYDMPVFYFTNPAAIRPADGDVPVPPMTRAFDYEVEIAAVIGLPGSNIRAEDAARHIAGYTLLIDWSSRDLQEREIRAGLGPAKGKDAATSLGPFLVTCDELEGRRSRKGFDCPMRVSVNGIEYGTGNWAEIYWSFEEMVSYASRGTTVRPGDIIGSGTLSRGSILELATGGDPRHPFLQPGDEVIAEIDGLGASISTVCASAALESCMAWPDARIGP